MLTAATLAMLALHSASCGRSSQVTTTPGGERRDATPAASVERPPAQQQASKEERGHQTARAPIPSSSSGESLPKLDLIYPEKARADSTPRPSRCKTRMTEIDFDEANEIGFRNFSLRLVPDGQSADPDGCLPLHVVLWVATHSVFIAKYATVQYDPLRPNQLTLTLDRVEPDELVVWGKGSPTPKPNPLRSGTIVGTFFFEHGVLARLRFGPGLWPPWSGLPSLRIEPR